jgi:hypothetical protein
MSLAQKFIRRLRSWFRRAEPQDPYAHVTAGLKRGPGGRSAAIALDEPKEQRVLNVFGRRQAN